MKNEKWCKEHIPDLKGKVVIITGANSGLGFETAKALANKNATTILAIRNLEKGQKVKEEILRQNEHAVIELMELDLADLESIRQFADQFKIKYTSLDILINNAGVMIPPYTQTKDGFELQFGTNHLGHFALTGHLFDYLKNTKNARIVNLSSFGHRFGKLNFDDLNWEKRKYAPWKAYGDSKLANLYFTYELDRKIKEQELDICVTAAHPGWSSTNLKRNTGKLFTFLDNRFGQSPEMGALPTLMAAIKQNCMGGEFFGPKGIIGGLPKLDQSNKRSKDENIAAKLWKISEERTNVKFNFT